MPEIKVVNIFLSYSHEDERLKDKLLRHLSPWKRQGLIKCWDDRQAIAGSILDEETLRYFNKADIILSLLSPDFIHSDSCYQIGVERAMARKENELAVIIPVLLRDVEWKKTPLGKLRVIPQDERGIKSHYNIDKIMKEVAQEIGMVVDRIRLLRI